MICALTSYGKYFIIFSVLLFSMFIGKSGQAQDLPPMPKVCTTPPPGYLIGGNFLVPSSGCTDPLLGQTSLAIPVQNISDNSGVPMTAVSYYFGLTDSVDITSPDFVAVPAVKNSGVFKASQVMNIGEYWVLQIGEKSGQKYLKCATSAVLDRSKPEAKIYTCNGSTVNIEIPDVPENRHDKYRIDWGNGFVEEISVTASNPLPIIKERTYSGTLAQVSIVGYYKVGNKFVCETYPNLKNPASPESPIINTVKFVNNGTGVELGYKNFSNGKEYEVDYSEDNGSNPNWVSGGKTQNGIFQLGGLNAEKKYCFRLKYETECGDFVNSNTVCNISSSSTLNSSSDVTINWELPANPTGVPQDLKLVRTTDSCNTCPPVNMPLTSNTDQQFRDQSITCSEKYTYTVEATYAIVINGKTEFITVTSGGVKVDPMDASVKIVPDGLINVGYPADDESLVKLVVYTESEISTYQFYHKAPGGDSFIQIGKSESNSFDDISVKPSQGSYCYKYSVEDACGVTSDLSPEFCTVFLTYQGNILEWSDYSFPDNLITNGPARYTVQMFDPNINTFLPIFRTNELNQAIGQFLSESDEPEVKFRVLAEQFLNIPGYTNFAFPSFSNTVTIPVPADVFVPSAFSPNGDGNNDTFKINSKFVQNASIVIFDRWGGIVFEGSVGGIAWDGTDASGSKKVPGGSYTYKINGKSLAGQEFSRAGTITLLR